MWNDFGLATNSFGTMNGPNGADRSPLLPANQFGLLNIPVSGRRPVPPRSLRSYMML
jgi:hypothetical protein